MPTDSEKVLSVEMRTPTYFVCNKCWWSGPNDADHPSACPYTPHAFCAYADKFADDVVALESLLASRTERVAALTDALTEIARIVHAPRSYGYDITHSARVQELTKPFHDGKLPKEKQP